METTLDRTFSADTAPHLAPAGSGAHSRSKRWTGIALSGVAVAFLAFDAGIKLVKIQPVVESMTHLGYPQQLARGIGLLELVCLALYLIPRTATLGALLWTGFLGGAISTHLRVGDPLFSHTLFPVYVALLLWGGLALRDVRPWVLLRGPSAR